MTTCCKIMKCVHFEQAIEVLHILSYKPCLKTQIEL